MDTKDLIARISKARSLPDVIDPAQMRREYKAAVRLLHPDRCSHEEATQALIRLNKLKEQYEKGIPFEDDAGAFRWFGNKSIFNGKNELNASSLRNFNLLAAGKDGAARHFRRFLPEAMRWNPDGSLQADFAVRTVPLSGLKLPQEHVNWILSRMLEWCAWLSQTGYVHGGIHPESVCLVPEAHGIILASF